MKCANNYLFIYFHHHHDYYEMVNSCESWLKWGNRGDNRFGCDGEVHKFRETQCNSKNPEEKGYSSLLVSMINEESYD